MTTMRNTIVLDTETTGIMGSKQAYPQKPHELLQLAIVDSSGETLFFENFKPVTHEQWPQAQRVHGITPSMVATCNTFEYYMPMIQQIVNSSDLMVAYNAGFDLTFLAQQGISLSEKRYYCVMKAFAPIFGQRSQSREGYVWKSLEVCARYYGYKEFSAHNALADAQATLHCYKAMELNLCQIQIW